MKGVVSSMSTSNATLNETIGTILNSYFSKFTGEEVDAAIEIAANLMAYLRTNLSVPAASFTGDFLITPITTLTQDMWLDSITIQCKQAFSASASGIRYAIETSAGDVLVVVPTTLLTDVGTSITFSIDKQILTETTINMVCSSTRAYGELLVKLNFQ